MKQTRTMQTALAVAVLACATMGSVERSGDAGPPRQLLHGDFTISVSSAAAGEARGAVRRASCTLVRYYVAKYTAEAAEAWARGKGATDAEIQIARSCIKAQQTALASRLAD
jgi:hypothetical protein